MMKVLTNKSMRAISVMKFSLLHYLFYSLYPLKHFLAIVGTRLTSHFLFSADEVTCPTLIPPANGRITFQPSDTTNRPGTTASYFCTGGFDLTRPGEDGRRSTSGIRRTCSVNGEWDDVDPICVGEHCIFVFAYNIIFLIKCMQNFTRETTIVLTVATTSHTY